jgi:acyl carrier protein
MEIETIKSELRNYIREKYNVSPEDPDFSDTVHLYDYGYIDSFGSVQFKLFVESKFSIQFSPTDMTTIPMNSVKEMAEFVEKRKKGEL